MHHRHQAQRRWLTLFAQRAPCASAAEPPGPAPTCLPYIHGQCTGRLATVHADHSTPLLTRHALGTSSVYMQGRAPPHLEDTQLGLLFGQPALHPRQRKLALIRLSLELCVQRARARRDMRGTGGGGRSEQAGACGAGGTQRNGQGSGVCTKARAQARVRGRRAIQVGRRRCAARPPLAGAAARTWRILCSACATALPVAEACAFSCPSSSATRASRPRLCAVSTATRVSRSRLRSWACAPLGHWGHRGGEGGRGKAVFYLTTRLAA